MRMMLEDIQKMKKIEELQTLFNKDSLLANAQCH